MSSLRKRTFLGTPLLAAAGLGAARFAQATGCGPVTPASYTLWDRRIVDPIDSHQPDLPYSGGGIPFGMVGRAVVAHLSLEVDLPERVPSRHASALRIARG